MDTLVEIKLILLDVVISQKETAEKFKKTDARFKEIDIEIKKAFKLVGKKLYSILKMVRAVSNELRDEIFASGLHLAIIHNATFNFKRNPDAIDWNFRA
jgi:hypothetical protein